MKRLPEESPRRGLFLALLASSDVELRLVPEASASISWRLAPRAQRVMGAPFLGAHRLLPGFGDFAMAAGSGADRPRFREAGSPLAACSAERASASLSGFVLAEATVAHTAPAALGA